METSHDTNQSQTRKAAVGGLAVVGFVALILIGIATAIYAASYLPKAFGHLSSANVYLSGLTQPGNDQGNTLQAVVPPSGNTNYQPTSTTTLPINPAPGTTVTSQPQLPTEQPTNVPTYTPPATTKPATPTYTQPTYTRVQVPTTPNYYGLPDLVTTITSTGYLTRSGDTSSFVANSTVPNGYQGAVRFVIANRGTNIAQSWNFEANLPTNDNQDNYRSQYQQALVPGASVIFTLGFDSTTRGTDTIRIQADPNGNVQESNENNNTDTKSIYLSGSSNGNNGGSSYDSNGNYCRYGTYYQNGRYYCNSSSNGNNNNSSSYDSNGNYCSYGTYYSNNRYYCNSSNNSNNNNGNSSYDSNGNYCRYGTYYQNGRYYCDTSSTSNDSNHYDSNGNYCSYGTYYSNNRYYCN